MRLHVRYALMALAIGGCARAAPSGETTQSQLQIITEREIAESHATTAYDAVVKLRANFLSNRGKVTLINGNASAVPVVYLDGALFGELSTLRSIPTSQISSIRLYRAWEAQQKYGNGKLGGVIEVTTSSQVFVSTRSRKLTGRSVRGTRMMSTGEITSARQPQRAPRRRSRTTA
jgi:hypothetical protein